MADIFTVDARGRILRNPTKEGYPASVAETTVVAFLMTSDEQAEILARPATDPVRIAFLSRPTATNGGGAVSSVAGKTGDVSLSKSDVGLSNVDNISAASLRDRSTHTGTQSADTLTDGTTNKAFLATERTKLAGIAAGATVNSSDATLNAYADAKVANDMAASTTVAPSKSATSSAIASAIAALVASSPAALDTLNELAAALGNDANFATTITNALALKAPLASPALTGTPTVPTATAGTSTTQAASTAFTSTAIATAVAGLTPSAGQRVILNMSSAQSIPTGALTGLAWTSEREDAQGWHATNSTDVIVPAGVYLLTFQFAWEENAASTRYHHLEAEEGTAAPRVIAAYAKDPTVAYNDATGAMVAFYVAAASTKFRIFVYQETGGALAIGTRNRPLSSDDYSENTEFSVVRLDGASGAAGSALDSSFLASSLSSTAPPSQRAAFAEMQCRGITPYGYGATGVGDAHEDAAGFQAAINAAIASGTDLIIPPPPAGGYWRISSQLLIQPQAGQSFAILNIRGMCGDNDLRWTGSSGGAMFRALGWKYSFVEGVKIVFGFYQSGCYGWDIDTNSSNESTGELIFRSCLVNLQNCTGAGWRYGHLSSGSGNDISNVQHFNCNIYGNGNVVGSRGIVCENPNALNMSWSDCGGQYLEKWFTNVSDTGARYANGAATMFFSDCGGSFNLVDYELANGGTYKMSGGRWELGKIHIKVTSGSDHPAIHYSAMQLDAYTPSDGKVFVIDRPASVIFDCPCITNSGSLYDANLFSLTAGAGSYMASMFVRGGAIAAADPCFTAATNWSVNFEDVAKLNSSYNAPARFLNRRRGLVNDYAAAAPSTGTWQRGDKLLSTAPAASGFEGFVCVTAGTPGTWKTYGAISA